jgi:tetratricopeptide (TPR) repeat protein
MLRGPQAQTTPQRLQVQQQPVEDPIEQIEFEKRLASLRQESEERQRQLKAQAASQAGVLKQGPRYDDPPPLSQTLLGKKPEDDADAASGSFGPSQVGLAVASLALVGVFILTSGDPGPSATRSSSSTGQQRELAPEQREDLKKQLGIFEDRLKANADDLEALEGAGVAHATLGDYVAAEKELLQLTTAKPDNVDAWRVLGETRALSGKQKESVEAYEKAWQASGRSSIDALTGLSDALVANGHPEKAVEAVEQAAAAAAAGSSSALDDVDVGLLLARSLAQWRGHQEQAVETLRRLGDSHPKDFRPPLARGLLMREQGREGDAIRYLLQARMLATPGEKEGIQTIIDQVGSQ